MQKGNLIQYSVFLSLILCWTLHPATGYVQELVLHDKATGDGNTVRFTDNIPNTSQINLADFKRICWIGWWECFEKANYVGNSSRRFVNRNFTCEPVDYPFKETFGSCRHVGQSNTNESSISLFTATDYSGVVVELTNSSEASARLSNIPKSPDCATCSITNIAITGASNWTLYDQPDFKGRFLCVQKNEQNNIAGSPSALIDVQSAHISCAKNITDPANFEEIGKEF